MTRFFVWMDYHAISVACSYSPNVESRELRTIREWQTFQEVAPSNVVRQYVMLWCGTSVNILIAAADKCRQSHTASAKMSYNTTSRFTFWRAPLGADVLTPLLWKDKNISSYLEFIFRNKHGVLALIIHWNTVLHLRWVLPGTVTRG